MLNEDKVKLMSKMAMFETREGKKAIETDRYSKRDFIFVQVIKTWILSTVGFGMVFLLTLLLCVDTIAVVLATMSISVILILIALLYLLCVFLSGIFARHKAIKDYEESRRIMSGYKDCVKQLADMYDEE
jgi:hypothetical protein